MNRLTPISRWPADLEQATKRAQTELSAIWFLKRIGFRVGPSMAHAQQAAQRVLREAGCEGK